MNRWQCLLAVFFAIAYALLQVNAIDDGQHHSRGKCSLYGPRRQCGPADVSQAQCAHLGCCWFPLRAVSRTRRVEVPNCYTANGYDATYALSDLKEQGESLSGRLQLLKSTQPELGTDISPLALTVKHIASDTLRIKIGGAGGRRWEVPMELFPPTPGQAAAVGSLHRTSTLQCNYTQKPFSLTVQRGTDQLFAIKASRFIFKDQYIEVNTPVPQDATIYGLGERTASAGLAVPRDGLPIVLWARDVASFNADTNLYGSHPFVMLLRKDGMASGMALLNSNALEVAITAEGIQWRVTGGVLDWFIMAGPSPADVMEQFTRQFGRPAMPPFWSLGFHQCKWGYNTIEELEGVVDAYADAGIPLQTIWSDIDYMEAWRDFTWAHDRYPLDRFQALIAKVHAKGQHWVPIVDPGIMVNPQDAAYVDGLAKDVFLKDVTGSPYIGQVWPGAVHYPDFAHPAAQEWWTTHLKDFHQHLAFDGVWLDMNELSNFCTGEVCEAPDVSQQEAMSDHLGEGAQYFLEDATVCFLKCSSAAEALNGTIGGSHSLLTVSKPPFNISNGNACLALGQNTAAMSVSHHDGTLQYDTHNLYGLQEVAVSHRVLPSITGKRPFILTRSTFLGSGAYAAHWTGDNGATWDDLRWSVSGMLASGLAGSPFVGADICGFAGNTTEELCNRWISAGAFYPFSRDHSGAHDGYQELYRWASVAQAARRALGLRYQLLPYLYSAFHEAHRTGVPIARPLFFAAPADPQARKAEGQWLLGDAVLVSPVLKQGATEVQAHFPAGSWHSLLDASVIDTPEGEGTWAALQAPLGHVPLHVRGGAIVPMQQPAMTTGEVRHSPLTLVVALQQQISSRRHILERYAVRWASNFLRLLHINLPGQWPAVARLQSALRQRPTASVLAAASGWMYYDGDGDSIEVSDAEDNFLSFSAVLEPASSVDGMARGAVTVHFGRPSKMAGLLTAAACSNVMWPDLQAVRILGMHQQVDPASVMLDSALPGSLAPARQGNGISLTEAGKAMPASQVSHSLETGVLEVSSLSQRLKCPNALRISWATTVASATA